MSADRGPGPAEEPVPEPFFAEPVDPFAPPGAAAAGDGGYPPPGAPGGPPGPVTPWGGPPGPGDPWGGPAPWASAYPRPRSTNGFAIASLCCGLVGLFTYGLLGILGVVFGVVALRQIGHDGQEGRGLAIAGITVGAVAVVLGVVALWWLLGAHSVTLPGPTA